MQHGEPGKFGRGGDDITYGTVKAAADHMTCQLAAELVPRIRVNAVAPGIIATDGLTAAVPPDVRDRIAADTPLRRLGSEQDVAAAVRWLLSQDAGCSPAGIPPSCQGQRFALRGPPCGAGVCT